MALRERMRAVAPSRREWAALALLATGLVLVAALVAFGTLTRADQYSLDHLMPWLDPTRQAPSSTDGYWRPFSLGTSTGAKLLDLLTYPCSLLLSGLCVGAAALHLRRSGMRRAALVPVAAWVIGNGLEWLGKHTLTRPALYGSDGGERLHVLGFDDSFPSGHMIRGILVAYTVVLAWKVPLRLVVPWVAAVAPALVLGAAHTPSDVLGGALIGLMLLVLMRAAVRPELARRQP